MPTLIPSWSDVQPFLPEMVLLATVCAVLLIPVLSPRKSNLATGLLSALGILVAILALMSVNSQGTAPATGGSFLGGMLIMDPFAWMLKLSILIFAFLVIALWAFTTRDAMGPGDGPEFFTLMLCATTGMCLMGSTSNLLMMFLAVEMASLPSYVLAGFRKTQRLGAEAALKYVLFGAVCSSIMLYGMSLIYGLAGSLELAAITAKLTTGTANIVLILGVIGLLVGIGFKIAMVPVHFWAPDVFEGTHIDIAAFLSVASKAGGLALLMRVLLTVTHASPDAFHWLAVTILVLGTVTCFWGNLAAFAQTNIKRLLAYSSIAHAGYMLLAMATIVVGQQTKAPEGILFYIFGYVFMNAGAFIAAAAIAQLIGSEDIRDYAGLSAKSPFLAAAMLVFLFSLVGIPMTVGFGAKLKLLLVMFNTDTWIGYVGVGVLAINTVIAAFYYFRVIKAMYLAKPREIPGEEIEPRSAFATLTPTVALAMLLVIPNVLLFLGYSWVDDQAHTFGKLHAMAPAAIQPADVAAAK